jgi:7,8-dihydro-6-hydroxymethylpterin-pyrophosphokinase
VLVWGDRVVRWDGPPPLEVPHPRLAERRFALLPLLALVGPDFVVPGHGPVGALEQRVRDQRVEEHAASW